MEKCHKMEGIAKFFAKIIGFTIDEDDVSASESEDREFVDHHKNRTLRKEQLEFYFSGGNLENDETFLKEIQKNEDRYVSFDFLLKCNRLQLLGSTKNKLIRAARESEYLEVDEEKGIRTVEPFVHDERRAYKTLEISGFKPYVPLIEQENFFKSIPEFSEHIKYIGLRRTLNQETKIPDVYTGRTIVEFDNEKIVDEIIERGIEYRGGLKITRLSDIIRKNKNNNNNTENRKQNKRMKKKRV